MFDYKGESCPHCKKTFLAGDDIVVCPECGAPHHRACYTEQGVCAYTERHETGFEWSAGRKAAHKTETGTAATVTCPHCGRSAVNEGRFCNFCGASFEHVRPVPAQETNQPVLIFGLQSDAQDTAEKIDVKEFDGIPVADWLTYIGRNATHYLGRFSYQDITGRKTWFTLSAALCPPLYFLYRKMWWWAIAATLLNAAFLLPTAALSLTNAGLHLGFDFDVATLTLMEGYLSYVLWGVNLILGLFAMYFYRHTAARRMRRIKLRSASEEDYRGRLERISGPSMAAAMLLPGLILLGMTVLNLLGLA